MIAVLSQVHHLVTGGSLRCWNRKAATIHLDDITGSSLTYCLLNRDPAGENPHSRRVSSADLPRRCSATSAHSRDVRYDSAAAHAYSTGV